MIQHYDLCIIGGGINGAGIARDAAGRGFKVLLVEQGDLACATSSASTKLIHGGLRYLEYFEFKLVRASLQERETLLSIAPHLVHPKTFVLPHSKGQRPYWMIGAGLFLYDHLAKRRRLRESHRLDLKNHPFGKPLQDQFRRGYTYSDCWVDDSRLVVMNAMDAASHGATIATRTKCIEMHTHAGRWHVSLSDAQGNYTITASSIINAAGPWVRKVIDQSQLGTPEVPQIRLIKGSHIIVPAIFEGDQAYLLQQPDKRIVFAIPYETGYTLIGTTDINFTGDPTDVQISPEEIEYLCAAVNRAMKTSLKPEEVQWTYSGVRSLFDDGKKNASSVTRDYHLHVHKDQEAPLISVFGGKLTTFRVLAEQAVDLLQQQMGRSEEAWTGEAILPGGDMPHADFEQFLKKKITQYGWMPDELIYRYARSYGTRMDYFLEGAYKVGDLGRHYGNHVYEAEILYLINHEWAQELEDILWRRSKLGLHVDEQTVQNLEKELPKIRSKMMRAS